jgi:hypothetical protein
MHLQVFRRKGVALADLALGESGFEPAHPLRRRTVGKRVRHHTALTLLLQAVITDGVGGVQGFFDIARFQPVQRFCAL